MRTQINLTDQQHSALLDLARERGMRGYSPLVAEAIDQFLRDRRTTAALNAITPEFGDHLYRTLREVRSEWHSQAPGSSAPD